MVNNQPIQSEFTTQSDNPPTGGRPPVEAKLPFSFARHQLILIGIFSALVLLFIFGLGIKAGEKRALRKYSAQPTPTLTPTSPSPTTVPTLAPTSPPTPANQSCFEGDDCVIGIEQGTQTIYSRGICKNGVCIPRPTSPPKREKVESK